MRASGTIPASVRVRDTPPRRGRGSLALPVRPYGLAGHRTELLVWGILLLVLGLVFLLDIATPASFDTMPVVLIAAIAAAWLLSTPLALFVTSAAVGLLFADAALGKIGSGTAAAESGVFLALAGAARFYASRLHGLLVGTGTGLQSRAASVFGLENLAHLVEASGDGVAAFDGRGRIVYANAAATNLLGLSSEVDPARLLDLVVEEDRDRVASYMASTAFDRPGTLSFRVSGHGGAVRVVEVSHTPFPGQGGREVAIVMRDVTEIARLLRASNAIAENAASLAVTQSLDTTLTSVARRVVEVSAARACVITLLGDGTRPRVAGFWGLPETYPAAVEEAFQGGADLPVMRAIRTRAPTFVPDLDRVIRTDPLLDPIRMAVGDLAWAQTVALPLLQSGEALGALSAYFVVNERLDSRTMDFLSTIAGQVASAVQVSQLVAARQGEIAVEERHRLSRRLHDSLSQALYGIVLGATSARKRLEHDPTRALEPLDYILELAEGALGEMRSLVLELRPESLEREGLVTVLRQHADALTARYDLEVISEMPSEPDACFDTKLTAYRIAQEALHNVVKHSHAQHAWLSIGVEEGLLDLEVRDDGIGFDVSARHPGHFGLEAMRERVAARGGEVRVVSWPGAGTAVRARIPILQRAGRSQVREVLVG